MINEIFISYNNISQDIIDLRTKVFINEQNVPKELELDNNEHEYIHCCLYAERKLVAYLRYSINEEKIAHIGRVCVDRDFRKMNYGKKIMLFAEDEIKKQKGFKTA